MKAFNLVLLTSIFSLFTGCYSLDEVVTQPTLEQECKDSGSKNSPQCQIIQNTQFTENDKEFEIGSLYIFGIDNVTRDCNKAKYWLEKSAELNNAKAFNGLGLLYSSGCGVSKNYKKAEEYYLLAIEGGGRHAKANLAVLYVKGGYGIEQDYDKAVTWFKDSVKDTPNRAYDGLSAVYFSQEKYEAALPYLIKGAELGGANAQSNLGYYYDKGLAGEQNKQKALYWYSEAAKKGHTMAQKNLARLLQELGEIELPEAVQNPSSTDAKNYSE